MHRPFNPTVSILAVSLACLAPLAGAARADVSLPNVIGSHMVLQRGMPLTIWGWAAPGEDVTVVLGESKASTKTDAAGNWLVKLPEMAPGGPFDMTITGKNTIQLTDILIGEVWIGSGQSNMQWPVAASANAQEEIKAADYSKLRLFSVPLVPSGTPAKNVAATWQVCTPQTVPGFSAVCYYFGRELHKTLDVPVGMIASSWGGTAIQPWIPPAGFASQKELDKERADIQNRLVTYVAAIKARLPELQAWLPGAEQAAAEGRQPDAMPDLPRHPLNSEGAPIGLYNGMIHPLVPFAFRGALWYQGESNRGMGMHYHTLMKALVQGWRTVWAQGDFPFLFVQLAPYRYDQNTMALPEIWEAQTASLSIPNTGMVVTTDIGNINDIHPANKHEVGRRLALWALAKTYGKTELVYSGPLFESMAVEPGQVRIKFKFAEGGLMSRDGKPLSWFSIAGEDKKFVPATADIEGDSLLVRSPQVALPVAVRFGWHQLAEPNLSNKAGLPASPFRTDRWADAVPAEVDVK